MEEMYQQYKDIVEFRMIYIREAHALDSNRPGRTAREKGIKNHTNYEERCTTAQMLLEEGTLTMPMLIDGMDNAVNEAYSAQPDRVFLVRADGRLAVAAARGPRGFAPALNDVQDWLEDFRDTGEEPGLPANSVDEADRATATRQAKKAEASLAQIEKIAGTWTVSNVTDELTIEGEITFSTDGRKATGIAKAGESESPLQNINFDGRQLSFSLTMHESQMRFAGEFDGTQIAGKLEADDQEFKSSWTRKPK